MIRIHKHTHTHPQYHIKYIIEEYKKALDKKASEFDVSYFFLMITEKFVILI